jgi:hypothetical protein
MTTINIKSSHKCAFCKYWYDPQNEAIQPKTPKQNVWSYDENAKKMCLKTNLEKKAMHSCGGYECKEPVL